MILYSAIRSGEGLRSKGTIISCPLHLKMTALIRLERRRENVAVGESAVRELGSCQPPLASAEECFSYGTGACCGSANVSPTQTDTNAVWRGGAHALGCKHSLFHLNFCCWCSLVTFWTCECQCSPLVLYRNSLRAEGLKPQVI